MEKAGRAVWRSGQKRGGLGGRRRNWPWPLSQSAANFRNSN